MQSAVEKYKSLIEYLKSDFLRGIRYSGDSANDDPLLKYVEAGFDIDTSQTQITKSKWIKRYVISEGSKCWDILAGNTSILFAHKMQTYRDQLLEEENIQGIITLKNKFFDVSAPPAAVIVLGRSSAQRIWLTSAASSEDIITIFSDISAYQKNVYYTDKLDPENFMPEKYNGEKERIDAVLNKYTTKTLKEIADIIPGKNVSRWALGETGIPYLRQRNIQNGVIIKPDTCVVKSAAEKCAKQLLQEGDILLTKNFGQHKVAKVTSEDLPAIASDSLFIIRAFGVPEEYLYKYFTSKTGKAILDKQLSSIERGKAVVYVRMADLKELRVPVFDEATMLSFSQIEDMRAADVLPMLNQMTRFKAYEAQLSAKKIGSEVEKIVYNDLLIAGWPEDDLQLNPGHYALDLKAGKWIPEIILLDGDNWLGAIEVKSDFSHLTPDWISKMKEIINESRIPCLIFSTGFYYEAHFTHRPIVKKLQEAPSKEMLLSILGKESD